MQIGFIGLGKMGTRMVEKLLLDGHTVIGWNRTKSIVDEFRLVLTEKKLNEHFVAADDIKTLADGLASPRIIWVMLPAGDATEEVLQELAKYVEKGDIIIDGGNAFYKDTQRRYDDFKEYGIRYLGIGVSGGIKAGERGYPLMAGGDKSAFEEVKPLLETLIKPSGGYNYFGTGGAGHFVKMVHNGIEYGMMQAIGEGYGVLEKSPYELDLVKIAELWQKNTIVTSFLNECAKDALEKDPTLASLEGVIDATGEAEWTVKQGKEEGVFVENIDQSLDFRRRSKTDTIVSSSFAARMVAALRHEFGGHKVKEK
jgi:6-phosphogluconate dehydrogenase